MNCPSCNEAPVNISLMTYSYNPEAFENPDQSRLYTCFTLNTERSVRRTLAYWIHIGTGTYTDIDLLFCDRDKFEEPHWSGLREEEFIAMEACLRQQKVESVIQVAHSLEALWEKAEYPHHHDNLLRVGAAYREWNILTERIWQLHLSKHRKGLSRTSPSIYSDLTYNFDPGSRDLHQKEFEDFDGSSDGYYRFSSWMARGDNGSSSAPPPLIAIRPEEEAFPTPDLSEREIVNKALRYWEEKNSHSDYYDLDYLAYLWGTEFGGDRRTSYNSVQGFGIKKSIAAWEVMLGLKQVLIEGRFPPKTEIAIMIDNGLRKWNQCSHDVQLKIDERIVALGTYAPAHKRAETIPTTKLGATNDYHTKSKTITNEDES